MRPVSGFAFSYQVALIQVIYLFLLYGRTYVSAHRRAHTQVRPYNSFSYFYERNLVSVCGWVRFEGAGLEGQGRRPAAAPRELCWGWGAGRWQAGQSEQEHGQGSMTRAYLPPPHLSHRAEQGQQGRREHGLPYQAGRTAWAGHRVSKARGRQAAAGWRLGVHPWAGRAGRRFFQGNVRQGRQHPERRQQERPPGEKIRPNTSTQLCPFYLSMDPSCGE
jgi:hypothetical protein